MDGRGSSPAPLLRVEGLTVRFNRGSEPSEPTLDDVGFEVGHGEIVGLVGPSGSGKSLTALSILRLLSPEQMSARRLALDGVDLLSLSAAQMRSIRGREISLVLQSPASALDPTARLSTQLQRVLPRDVTAAKISQLLIEVGLPNTRDLLRRYPHELSGGEQQRLVIAMALAKDPRLLIADEPTTALDPVLELQMLDQLSALRQRRGLSILLISHDLGVTASIADRLVVLAAGKVLETVPGGNVLQFAKHPSTRALLYCRPILGDLRTRLPTIGAETTSAAEAAIPEARRDTATQVSAANTPPINAASTDREPVATTAFAEPLLRVRNLSVMKPGRTVASWWTRRESEPTTPAPSQFLLRDVDLDLARGGALAILGRSGAGKTTLARAIARLGLETTGSILFDGVDLSCLSERAMRPMRRRFQLVLQDPGTSLNPQLTVSATIEEPLRVLCEMANAADRKRRTCELMVEVGLDLELSSRRPHQLSGGERQRVSIARALASAPDLLICDEITSALDVGTQARVLNLLEDLRERLDLALIIVTHDLAVASFLAEHIAVMDAGRIVEIGTVNSILERPRTEASSTLVASARRMAAKLEH